jgi:hypothetical protein
MSLLSQAAPYDTTNHGNSEIGDDTYLPAKRRTAKCSGGGKTIKKRPPPGQPVERKKCVEALMMMTGDDSDDDSGLADFHPPSNPELTRMPNGQENQEQSRERRQVPGQGQGQLPQPRNLESQPSSYEQAHSPPQNLRPDVSGALASIKSAATSSTSSSHYASQMQNGAEGVSNKGISEQLNYIIHLLEEQQNSKTSTTTEELILYTFLGVFTIYIVDSFTKVGKPYTR